VSDMVDTVLPTGIYQPCPRHHLLHRITRDPWHELLHLARRAVSATLHLSWQLDITVVIDADVYTDDRAGAAALFEQYLRHPQTQLTAYGPSLGPIGWRDIATGPVTAPRDVTVDDNGNGNGNAEINFPWSVQALATLHITVAAGDLDPDMYVDLEPDGPEPGNVRNILAVIHTVTRTPVRRR
jgi:hypothetical protein